MKTYIVTDIEEPDFGCEGVLDGQQIIDIVTLRDKSSNEDIKIKVADAYLYSEDIDIGTEVTLHDGLPQKS